MERIVDKIKWLDALKQKGIGILTVKEDGYNMYLSRPSENQVLIMTDYNFNQLVLCSIIG